MRVFLLVCGVVPAVCCGLCAVAFQPAAPSSSSVPSTANCAIAAVLVAAVGLGFCC